MNLHLPDTTDSSQTFPVSKSQSRDKKKPPKISRASNIQSGLSMPKLPTQVPQMFFASLTLTLVAQATRKALNLCCSEFWSEFLLKHIDLLKNSFKLWPLTGIANDEEELPPWRVLTWQVCLNHTELTRCS